MSVNPKNTDLCAPENEALLKQSIDLFKQMFQLPDDPELYYYFSTLSVLKLLLKWRSIGIKVEPALVHVPEDEQIDLSIVLRPMIHPNGDHDGKTLGDLLAANDIQQLMQILDEAPNTLGGSSSSACCPTPGRPLNYPTRKEKLTIWIENLTQFRDSL